MSGRRRSATARAGEGQLSLLAGMLTETDRAVLELARGPGLQARVADRAQHLLGLSPTRYFQLLGRLLGRPEAADAEPELVAGLRAVPSSANKSSPVVRVSVGRPAWSDARPDPQQSQHHRWARSHSP